MMETPILYEMLLVLLKKEARIHLLNHKLKPKPRMVKNVALLMPLLPGDPEPSLRIFYQMDAKQSQDWRGLSTTVPLDWFDCPKPKCWLEQGDGEWMLHVNNYDD
jgi:hypothetical protein